LETLPLYPALSQELNPFAVLVLLARNIVFCVLAWRLITLKNVESLSSV